MKTIMIILSTFLFCTLFCCCSDDNEESYDNEETIIDLIPKKNPIRLTESQRNHVKTANNFTFNLFRHTDSRESSRIVSPISATFLLGMLNAGATGETSNEIMNVMGFEGTDKKALNEFCSALIENAPKVDSNVKLNIANGLFANNEINILPAYIHEIQRFYKASAQSLDFSNPTALSIINQWCGNQTNGMISHILEEVSPDAFAYLINIINFKATWTERFNPKHTQSEIFTKEDGTKITLPMMHRRAKALYAKSESFSALCLPYSSGAFNMYILLPNDGVSVNDVINGMTDDSWSELRDKMNDEENQDQDNTDYGYKMSLPRYIDIKIPRFSASYNIELDKILKGMGLEKAFSDRAEFPYISDQDLHVTKMWQSSKIEVDEQGTKTATATAAEMAEGALPEIEIPFHADHPFAYIIQENTSDVIFFIGTYMGL